MRWWIELLPLFVVRKLARRCEAIRFGSITLRYIRPGVYVEIPYDRKP